MNVDARLTLYGGVAIGSALLLLGAATDPVVGQTGVALTGAALAIALAIEHLCE